ncbi:MAG: hypothetical protein IRZ04_01820 [Rhodospirillales bacterium]|nr:hypothetical protein [Rhodospirillales bacterium]
MKSARHPWSVLWYAAVLAAAIAWGYVAPAETDTANDDAAAVAVERIAPFVDNAELRRVAEQMILR